MSSSLIQQQISERQMSFTRRFNAPRELVFSVWTDPAHITHWWGPEGFRTTTENMDLRAGGEWRFVMHGPDGRDYKNIVVFSEVRRPELLRYRHTGDDDTSHISFEAQVEFVEVAEATEVTLSMQFATAEELRHVCEDFGAEEGARQTLSRFGQHLNKIQGESNE